MSPSFSITDLGVLPGGAMSAASSVNNAGQVVGWSFVEGRNFSDGFLWESGSMTALGTDREYYGSRAAKINNLGQVLGLTYPPQHLIYQGSPSLPFLYERGSLNYFSTTEREEVCLCDINDRSQIVGIRETWKSRTPGATVGRQHQSFFWENGVETVIVAPGWEESGAFIVTALNEEGQVVGGAYPPGSDWAHASLWHKGNVTDLGTFGFSSRASDINDFGQIVGDSETLDFDDRAFLWENNAMRDLGTLPGSTDSEARAINNVGQIVGVCFNYEPRVGNMNVRSFLWQNETMIDLNAMVDPALGWEFGEVLDINDHGQIVCNGTREGLSHGLLLSPL